MFVVSFKSSKKKLIVLGAAAVLLAAALIFAGTSDFAKPAANVSGVDYSASTNEERLSFISQFGWEVDKDPSQVQEVLIPAEFSDVYKKYNEIQKNQKLDLEKYKGMRAKRWSYTVRNHPGYEGKDTVRINLLVYEGRVIGGDVCSTEIGGFMHGFDKTSAVPPAQNSEAST